MKLLYTDQAEYYIVCGECYSQFYDLQWSGSTRSSLGWRARAESTLRVHEALGRPCEFCGPNGNGGWMIDGKWPAAERRDARKASGEQGQ